MSNDLLFSVLPREGKVSVKHDIQKVKKIDKQDSLKPLSDEEQELRVEEKDAKQQGHAGNEYPADKEASPDEEGALESPSQRVEKENMQTSNSPKGPKHLDIFV